MNSAPLFSRSPAATEIADEAPDAAERSAREGAKSFLLALLLTLGFSFAGVMADPWLGEGYASLVFVLGISMAGALCGLSAALASALISAILFNYFVSEPVFEVSLNRSTDVAPLVVFLLCAVISGWLSGRLRDEATRAARSNRQLERLLVISRHLQRASSDEDVLAALVPASAQGQVGLYRFEEGKVLAVGASASSEECLLLASELCEGASEWRALPDMQACRLAVGQHRIGALVLSAEGRGAVPVDFLLAQARMTALALERIDLARRLGEANAAARTEELKTALLASVSHDLRSPLTAISTSAATLLAFGSSFDSETSRELLSGIVEESSRLNHLTTNLLQMTRLHAGEEGLYWTELPAVETLRTLIRRLHKREGVRRIEIAAPPEELLIRSDTALFDLVITNILQNALRYSPVDAPVIVTCAARGDECVFSVTDEGEGIPPAEQERIFERFYRVERGDRAPRGTGLGLAIARGFVKACGGSITVTSPVREGRGTTMTIRLPLTDTYIP